MVYRRSRSPALGRLRPSAHQGCCNAVFEDGRRAVFAGVLRHRLRYNIRLRSIFHSPTFARWPRARCVGPGENDSGSAAGCCDAILHGGTPMSATDPSALALFWVAVIGVAILAYVVLDGFDLGVGILFGATKDAALRDDMIASISPFWDGNETWLIVVGATLFAAFPAVYAVFLGAFYIPVLLLLFGLIFRGIAFEFRGRAKQMLWVWDNGFFIGSIVVAFVQGAAV